MTLEELAKFVGVSKQTIQRYEIGQITNIPSDRIEKMANALSVSPSELMGWKTEKTEAKDELSELIKLLPKDKQNIAIKILRSLIDE
jgi:repressor LexA